MRILLLPLTRRQTLLYAQRLTQNETHKPHPWLIWASQKAQKTWVEWGQSETKWKSKTVETGNRLLDQVDWEEYSLKTVHDPKSTKTEAVRTLFFSMKSLPGSGFLRMVREVIVARSVGALRTVVYGRFRC